MIVGTETVPHFKFLWRQGMSSQMNTIGQKARSRRMKPTFCLQLNRLFGEKRRRRPAFSPLCSRGKALTPLRLGSSRLTIRTARARAWTVVKGHKRTTSLFEKETST